MADTQVSTPPPAGLPPIAPPSGRHIIQMFVAPALIVGVIVGGLVIWRWLLGGPPSPTKILNQLDDANMEVRWRAASELAQILPRDKDLAQNPAYALDVVERLHRAMIENRDSEKIRKERLAGSKDARPEPPKSLRDERDLVQFLIACTGKFTIPVGATVLQELALDRSASEEEIAFRRRSQAVYALGEMGRNVKQFLAQPEERRAKTLAALRGESEKSGDRGRWAAQTARYLEARQDGKAPSTLAVSQTLIQTARDNAPFLRGLSALALGFWDGDEIDAVLLQMTRDDGHGEDPIDFPAEEKEFRQKNPDLMRQIDARDIADAAAVSLAIRGSPVAEQLLDRYADMLDETRQREAANSGPPNLRKSAEARVVASLLRALHAVKALHAARPNAPMPVQAIERLTTNSNNDIRASAQELKNKLK